MIGKSCHQHPSVIEEVQEKLKRPVEDGHSQYPGETDECPEQRDDRRSVSIPSVVEEIAKGRHQHPRVKKDVQACHWHPVG